MTLGPTKKAQKTIKGERREENKDNKGIKEMKE
jgi:hypothetical protein